MCHNGAMDIRDAVRRYLAPQPTRYQDNAAGMPSQRDIMEAARIAGEWRKYGPQATAAILYYLHMNNHMSHGALEKLTGIPTSTIARYITQHRAELTATTGGGDLP